MTNPISERIWFGTLLILGFLLMGFSAAFFLNNSPAAIQLLRDMALVIGPLLGVIVNATWKTDKIDGVNANTAAVLAGKSPDLSTATVVAAPGGNTLDGTLTIPPTPVRTTGPDTNETILSGETK